MQHFQVTFETRKRSFISVLLICITASSIAVPRVLFDLDIEKNYSAKLSVTTLVPVTST